MKGMLQVSITSHEGRIDALAQQQVQFEARLDIKGREVARQDERIKSLEDDNSARWGRVTGILSLIVAGAALIFTLVVPGIPGP